MTLPENRKNIIASRIRAAREMAGLSQGQVAKILGLHRPSVSEAEAGNRSVTAEELAKLAELYDVPVGWLLGDGAEEVDPHDDKIQLAARELTKLKPEDQKRLFTLLASMRKPESSKS